MEVALGNLGEIDMKYIVRYIFGDITRQYICKDSYELERIIEFMNKYWRLTPFETQPIVEDEKEQRK